MRQSFGVGQIINRYKINIFIAQTSPQNIAPDAPKPLIATLIPIL